MRDKLKEFIQENDAAFDALPSAGHFERFKQKQAQAQKTEVKLKLHQHPLLKVVAMFILFFAVGWLFYNLGKQQTSDAMASSSSEIETTANAELMAAEDFFASQLKEKKLELLGLVSVNEPEIAHIMLELDQLEHQYNDLKEELAVNSNNQRIVSAMVQNYRTRLEVLERLLEQLKKSESLKQKHHDQIQA